MGIRTITLEFFGSNLKLAPRRIRMFRQYMAMDPSTMACIPYIQRRLGVSVDLLLSALGLNDEPAGLYTTPMLVASPLLITLIKHTLTMYATVQVAYGLSILNIMSCIDFTQGSKLWIIGLLTSQLLWDGKLCRNSAIGCVRDCLQDETDIKTKGDALNSHGHSLWKRMSHYSSSDELSIRDFMGAVFPKHKLLFDYLTHSTQAELERVCSLHPDVALILCGPNAKPARTVKQKLAIASTWTGLLLLDLLQIDAYTVLDSTPIDLVVQDSQFSNQSVCIEI